MKTDLIQHLNAGGVNHINDEGKFLFEQKMFAGLSVTLGMLGDWRERCLTVRLRPWLSSLFFTVRLKTETIMETISSLASPNIISQQYLIFHHQRKYFTCSSSSSSGCKLIVSINRENTVNCKTKAFNKTNLNFKL